MCSALPLVAFAPAAAAAEPFAASVLACAAEADRERRLDCYDRAVASFTAKLSDGKRDAGTERAAAVTAAGGVGTGGVVARAEAGAGASGAAPQAAGSGATTNAPAATANGAGATTNTSATTDNRKALPTHISAQVTSVDYFPDHVVVHLDNHQVWQQVSEGSSELGLQPGDPVTVDRQMGSYWLAGRKGGAIQVKLKAAPPAR
jgi:hypothetical protein